jgi:hypothetical protein
MCIPAAALAIGGLILTGIGGIYEGKAERASAEYSAKVDENNAAQKDYIAQNTALIGSVEEERHRAKVRQLVGTQRATLAANGLDLSGGTALDLVTETAGMGEEDALTIRYNAAREAWGLREEAKGLRSSAAYKRVAGKNAQQATFLTTGAKLLSGAASLKYNRSS